VTRPITSPDHDTASRPGARSAASDRIGVACDGMTVRYGDVVAVDAVTLSVARGEIFGLLGPNGAGKTSVIRALTTIVPIAAGSATVAGCSLDRPSGVRARIGVLPESTGYPGSQSAIAYLRFYGRLFGLDQASSERRARQLLEQFGLAHRPGRIAAFSRGMRQRLGMCRALMSSPAVLFLDEPTLGLDPIGKDEMLDELARIAVEEGTCVVLCSHLLDEVERVCDRIGVLHEGRKVAEGTLDEVIAVAGVAGFGTIRVAIDDITTATDALHASPAVAAVRFDNARPGDIRVELASSGDGRADILRRLVDAGVDVRSFDLQGARLSDAFRALTASKGAG
jgi:ABC-2 type transport system ATP-binding protein